ncbi:MarR family winged helix-turn-helix transcriptional regulator [Aquibacillus sediminis]|uniref:MarR family winged helix-turn-helix transcriptional regulator n=1 Tax=Aquibacillus sediminis TaxID=2574734 RepID=UPI001109B9C8|nr:MarR family transcriptional regulator [Aquibacillus sediminis]
MDSKAEQAQSLKLFIVLNRALQSITNRVKENIKTYGLNPTEFAVLELLYHKGDQPIQKIGDKVLLASGSITYVVDKLETKELLQRKPCPNDRRVTYAAISEIGIQLMDNIFPKHMAAIHEILGGLSYEDKALVIDKMKELGIFASEFK